MTATDNIFLIGPMGAGKTTIGKKLAARLGMTFVDSDEEIERRTGTTIPIIFEIEGEAGFRAREVKVIDELSQGSNTVLATGGGSVMAAENQACLRQRGTVVYLATSIEEQVRRTRNKRDRPLINTADPEQQLRELAAVREPVYAELANVTVESDGRRANAVVAEILEKLGRLADA